MRTLTQLAELIARHAGSKEGIHDCALAGVSLIYSRSANTPVATVYKPMLCVIAQGEKDVLLGQQHYCYNAAYYLLVSVDLPVTGTVTRATADSPYLSVGLELDLLQLHEMALSFPHLLAATSPMTTAGIAINPLSPELLDALVRLLQLLDSKEDIPVLAEVVQREIFYLLLKESQNTLLKQLLLANSQLQQIVKAICWLKDNYTQPCHISELAETIGMSRSAFYSHFKAVTAMSPIAYRTQLRLQRAQQLMLKEQLDAATAGFQVGYESPSQFSREYRQLFGASPLQHVRQLKQAASND